MAPLGYGEGTFGVGETMEGCRYGRGLESWFLYLLALRSVSRKIFE
jgi:hypothetical protein